MLPKRSRFRRDVFTQVFKSSRRQSGEGFVVLYALSPAPRAAIVVSKKVAKTAIRRNKIRRTLYRSVTDSGILLHKTSCIVLVSPVVGGITDDVLRVLSEKLTHTLTTLCEKRSVG